MQTIAGSRGFVLLAKSWSAWAMLVFLVCLGVPIFASSPPGSVPYVVISFVWILYVVSILAAVRTKIELSQSELVVHGRLRRKRVDLAGLKQFKVEGSSDFWSFFVFLFPAAFGTWIWTITVVRLDGSEEVLSSIVGGRGGCRHAVREMNRLIGRAHTT